MKKLLAIVLLLGATTAFAADPPFDTKARLLDAQKRFVENRTLAAALDQAANAMQREAEALQELMKREEAAKKAAEKPEPVKEIEK